MGPVLGKSLAVAVFALTVLTPSALAAPTVSSVSPDYAYAGTSKTVKVLGSGFQPGAKLSMGGGIVVTSMSFVDSAHLTAAISVGSAASTGPRTPTVTNPDGGKGSCHQCFIVPPAGISGTIAFTRRHDTNPCTGDVENVYKMHADGGAMSKLTSSPGGTLADEPLFSPDGMKIAFTVVGEGTPCGPSGENIELMDRNGANKTAIPGTSGDGASGWSPDGSKLLFTGTNEAIWVMNADGTAQRQLTTPPSGDFDGGASYSPDGNKIAFARFTPSTGSIVVDEINADGSGLTQIAAGNEPSWSPDGAKIVFVCGSPLAICTMNADGSNVTKLFQSSINGISTPTWSPDGTRIAFARQHTSGQSILSDVYEMKADGSALTQITFVGDVPGGLSWTR